MKIDTSFGKFDFGDLKKAEADFYNTDIAVFRKLISKETATKLKTSIFDGKQVMRRDFLMPTSDNTPRHMSVVNGLFLNTKQDIIALYKNPQLLEIIDAIAYNEDSAEGHAAYYDDPLENMVATRLEKPGDTHGYHVDDPALALIICLESPPKGMGGDVEYHIKNAQGHRTLEQTHLDVGDAYLMRTDCMLHRVMPLKANFPRSILNLTYDFENRNVTPNGSATLLFQPT